MTLSATPITTPAAKARGNDTILATTAATRARMRVFEPSNVIEPTRALVWAAMRHIATVARAPPIAQTNDETSLGLMPTRRARSRLLAEAFTVFPSVVRARNQASSAETSGTTTSVDSCGPLMRTPRPKTFSMVDPIARGNSADLSVKSG